MPKKSLISLTHQVYQLSEKDDISVVTDPLFSESAIYKKIVAGNWDFFEVFLATGYERKISMLDYKKKALTWDVKKHDLQMNAIKLVKNGVERFQLNKNLTVTGDLVTQVTADLEKKEKEFKEILDQRIEEGDILYQHQLVDDQSRLQKEYQDNEKQRMEIFLNDLMVVADQPLSFWAQLLHEEEASLKKAMQQKEQIQKNISERLEQLKSLHKKKMLTRKKHAERLLKKNTHTEYTSFLNDLIEGTNKVSIPASLSVHGKGEQLLKTVLDLDRADCRFVDLLLERGADPLAIDNEGKNPLQIAVKKYIDNLSKKESRWGDIFKALVNAFGGEQSITLLNYDPLDLFHELPEINGIYRESANFLHTQVKTLFDFDDFDFNLIERRSYPIEVNTLGRVDKFIIMHNGLLEALENLHVEPLLVSIDKAYTCFDQNSRNFWTDGKTLHRWSRLISGMLALKEAYLQRESDPHAFFHGREALILLNQDIQRTAQKKESAFFSQFIREQEKRHQAHIKELACTSKKGPEVEMKTREDVSESEKVVQWESTSKEKDIEIEALKKQLALESGKVGRYEAMLQELTVSEEPSDKIQPVLPEGEGPVIFSAGVASPNASDEKKGVHNEKSEGVEPTPQIVRGDVTRKPEHSPFNSTVG